MIQYTEKDGSIIFNVRVVPRASKSKIAGELNSALKVRIASPPVDGAANAELIKLLSKKFNAPKSAIEIIGGYAAKQKQIRINKINSTDFINSILNYFAQPST